MPITVATPKIYSHIYHLVATTVTRKEKTNSKTYQLPSIAHYSRKDYNDAAQSDHVSHRLLLEDHDTFSLMKVKSLDPALCDFSVTEITFRRLNLVNLFSLPKIGVV